MSQTNHVRLSISYFFGGHLFQLIERGDGISENGFCLKHCTPDRSDLGQTDWKPKQ
jgi:hypothetical protein